MTIFDKRLSDYAAFAKPFMILVLIVGGLRLGLSLGGASDSIVKWISVTAVMWIGVLYFAIKVHTAGFGSYKHLLPVLLFPNLVGQAIAIIAIVIGIVTGNDNIYTAPEYSFGQDGKTWLHAGAHLLLGTTIGTLVGWLVGCVIMFITKRLVSGDKNREAAQRA
jgi:hypothetical protein